MTRPASAPALAALALAVLSACAKKPPPPPPPPEVGFVTLHPEAVTLVNELPGRTNPYVVAEVRPQVNGVIRSRRFTEGADVRAGQVLYEIDPAPYQAALAQAQAAQANSEANLATARVRFERYADLVKINAVSRQEVDDARAAYGQAQANVQQGRAQVQTARINLGYTRVTAPVSGRIGRAAVTQGGLATAGQAQALAVIQQLDPIYVDVAQSSDDLLRMKREMAGGRLEGAGPQSATVRLVLSDGSEYAQTGQLRFSEAQVDTTTGSVTLRALFPNPNRTLLPGMYVRARMAQATDSQGVLVPQAALGRDEKGAAFVTLVGPGDKALRRPVTAARMVGDKWLVTAGLQGGERLITEGLVKLQQPGSPVRPVPAGSRPQAPPGGAGGAPGGATPGSAGPAKTSNSR